MCKKLFFRKKSPYLLLEVMIAIMLIGISIHILFDNPLRVLRRELSSLEKLELKRMADLSFAIVKENLYANTIKWDDITHDGNHKFTWENDGIEGVKKKLNTPYEISIKICNLYGKKKDFTNVEGLDENTRLLKIEVEFIPKKKKGGVYREKEEKRIEEGLLYIYEVCVTRVLENPIKNTQPKTDASQKT